MPPSNPSLTRILFREALLIVLLSLALGLVRQKFPNGLSFGDSWSVDPHSAADAYARVMRPGDPRFMSLEDAASFQRENAGLILDARASADFAEGRIAGARNLPFYEIDAFWDSAMAGTEAGTPLMIYCEGVGCELSLFLGRELQSAGYENIGVFYGGWPAWFEAGLPVERDGTDEP